MKPSNNALFAAIALFSITAILQALKTWAGVAMPNELMLASRLLFAGSVLFYAYKIRSLSTFIFAAMIAGILAGIYLPKGVAVDLKLMSDIFLKLIKTIIAPLLFGTLVVGIAGHSDIKQVGRMGWKSLVYFEIVTTFALVIGLIAINISQAGAGLENLAVDTEAIKVAKPLTWKETILHIFPKNIVDAVGTGEVLQVVVFSILFGIGLAMLSKEKRKPMIDFAESLTEAMFKFTNIVMLFAPFAVFGALAYTLAMYGIDVFGNLIQLLLTLYAALVVFIGLVLIPIMMVTGIPVLKFLKAVREPATLAFATASSESALPIAMERMVEFGVPKKIVAFVLPTGYSFNLDGTTLYLSLAAIFVAQASGVQLSVSDQLLIVFTLMLTSKGVAGVPRASFVILLATVSSFSYLGLKEDRAYLILGIDAFMDMARTAVNVFGNCLASAVVAKWEGELKVNKHDPEPTLQ
jgi:proton glutamate symport protein